MRGRSTSHLVHILFVIFSSLFCKIDRASSFIYCSVRQTVKGCRVDGGELQHDRRLYMSSPPKKATSQKSPVSDGGGKQKTTGSSAQQVIYQKVVRPSVVLPDLLFLGYLVEYLESHFALPPRLPMIYESSQPEEGSRYVLAWNSPLSPSPEETRLEVEVIGIYSEGKVCQDTIGNDKKRKHKSKKGPTTVPDMAMVVVRKLKQTSVPHPKCSKIPQMMRNLFSDSEKQIVKALDRGLEDFMAGRIKFGEHERDIRQTEIPTNVKTAEEAIEAELVSREHQQHNQDSNMVSIDDIVLDTTATTIETPASRQTSTSKKVPNRSSNDASVPSSRKKKAPTVSNETARAAAIATMRIKADVKPVPDCDGILKARGKRKGNGSDDYAVQAAKRIAIKSKRQAKDKDKPTAEDYAVAAARKMAVTGMKRSRISDIANKEANHTKGKSSAPAADQAWPASGISQASPVNDVAEKDISGFKIPDTLPRTFRTTISRPGDRTKVKKNVSESSPSRAKTQSANRIGARKVDEKSKGGIRGEKPAHGDIDRKSPSGETSPAKDLPNRSYDVGRDSSTVNKKKRSLNLNVVDPETDYLEDPYNMDKISDPVKRSEPSCDVSASKAAVKEDKPPPPREQIERDIMVAAADVMNDLAEQGQDMTPEELLEDVLKFDKEKKQENAEGSGFVSGAFEKAKEILRDQNQQREARLRSEAHEKKIQMRQSRDVVTSDDGKFREVSIQEELRQMFEAGQNIAEGRITQIDSTSSPALSANQKSLMTATEKELVDDLVAREKSVSSHARILDEELAELEVRINSSPGEELDGTRKNPVFDVLSGPEVYNPNVDPETINYPGAIPGTKDVRLPKELDEAVKQARFASDVLQTMEQTEVKRANGEIKVQYRVGKQELSQNQVDNLRKVVVEASNLGLIGDPLILMAERSRLQMVLDELWDQPEERFREIASNYKDLLLSDNFATLVKKRLNAMAERDVEALRREDESLSGSHQRERVLLGQLVVYAQLLLKETKALGAELEAQQLEVIRSICKVAMDPSHTTEEQTAMALTDAVRDMRPLLDDVFVAYLKYAIAEEKGRLARAGVLDDPEHNQWLFVLQIVQQGVYKEISRGINRYLEHIWVSMW